MKDWLYFPFVAAIAGAMIYVAMSFGQYEVIDRKEGVMIEGRSLSTLYPAEGTSYSIAGDNINPHAYAVLSAHVARDIAPGSAGIFMTLSPADKANFAGKQLRISVMARKGRSAPLDSFDIAYFAPNGGGQSEWQTFELTNEFQIYSFVFRPAVTQAQTNDFVGFWPDVQGRARTMDVKWLKVEIIPDEN